MLSQQNAHMRSLKRAVDLFGGGKGFYVKARNRELLKEDQIRQIEEKMMDAVEQAKEMGVSLRELKKCWKCFMWEGDSMSGVLQCEHVARSYQGFALKPMSFEIEKDI